RALPPPYADDVSFLPNARAGESAVVGLLRSHERIVGVELTYIDANCRKSLRRPDRRHFMRERASDAVFELQATTAGVRDFQYDRLVFEGLADGLSGILLQRPCRIVALPGIKALRHISVAKGERVLVVADGDEKDSSAYKGLI